MPHFHRCAAHTSWLCLGLIPCGQAGCDPNQPDMCRFCVEAELAKRGRR